MFCDARDVIGYLLPEAVPQYISQTDTDRRLCRCKCEAEWVNGQQKRSFENWTRLSSFIIAAKWQSNRRKCLYSALLETKKVLVPTPYRHLSSRKSTTYNYTITITYIWLRLQIRHTVLQSLVTRLYYHLPSTLTWQRTRLRRHTSNVAAAVNDDNGDVLFVWHSQVQNCVMLQLCGPSCCNDKYETVEIN